MAERKGNTGGTYILHLLSQLVSIPICHGSLYYLRGILKSAPRGDFCKIRIISVCVCQCCCEPSKERIHVKLSTSLSF